MIIKIYLVLLFLSIGIIHVYWAFGGGWGIKAAIPENDNGPLFKAEPGGTLFIAALFITGAIWVLIDFFEYKIIFLQNYLYHFIALVFFARAVGEFKYVGFFKKIKNTKFALYDYIFYSPICLSVSLAAISILIIQ